MTTKLHAILAVEETLKDQAKALILDLRNKFAKGTTYLGNTRTLSIFDKPTEKLTEIEALEAKEKAEVLVADTVTNSIKYATDVVGSYWDLVLQKEKSNQKAVADIIVDNKVILKDAPVLFLMKLEAQLADTRSVLLSAPSLDNAIKWERDANYTPAGVYRTPEHTSIKTAKQVVTTVTVPPTDKHPAQVKEQALDVNIGRYSDTKFSGAMPTPEKAAMLERIDKLIRAVKAARTRANNVDAAELETASASLLGYALNGTLPA